MSNEYRCKKCNSSQVRYVMSLNSRRCNTCGNIENSQKILEYLANTPFNDKIAAGVPEGVTVSHKIGVSAEDKTFSDCGIVYAPNRNYILCLGSNGSDEKRADQFMAEVSKAVYDYVINN